MLSRAQITRGETAPGTLVRGIQRGAMMRDDAGQPRPGGSDGVASPPPVGALLDRLRAGDREAAALFVQHYGPMVRRRVRGKLGAAMRRLFDSQDILSTVSRRLDRYVSSGRVRAVTEAELWSLVHRMVDAALVDKVRIVKRLGRAEADDTDFARLLLGRLQQAETSANDGVELELDRAFASLPDPIDRQILSLWLRGHKHPAIASVVGLSHDAARQRWHTIRQRLRATLDPRASPRAAESPHRPRPAP